MQEEKVKTVKFLDKIKSINLISWLLIIINILLLIIIFQLFSIKANMPNNFKYIEKSLENIESKTNDIDNNLKNINDNIYYLRNTTEDIYSEM